MWCKRATGLVLMVFMVQATAYAGLAMWWTGGGSDDLWSNVNNWNTGKAPTGNAVVIFDSDGNARNCVVDVDVTISELQISVNSIGEYTGTITVPAGRTLYSTKYFGLASTMVVNGALQVESSLYWNSVRTNSDTSSVGNLIVNAGAALVFGPDAYFRVEDGASLTMAGTAGSPIIVTCPASVMGDFVFYGNVSLDYVRFYDLGDSGLQLSSNDSHTVSASNLGFMTSGSTAAGSQYLLVNDTAWDDYTFNGFYFAKGAGSTDPEFAVQNGLTPTIHFRSYNTGPGAMYGELATDTASTGFVDWGDPDLTILSIVPSDSNPTVILDTISVAVTVKNLLGNTATNFRVDLFQDEGSPPPIGNAGTWYKTVPSLAAGATAVVTFSNITNPGPPGTWNMYASVDGGPLAGGGQVITEADETNNVAGPVQVIWGGGSLFPDLWIESITASPSPAPAGGTTTVTARVWNTGTADAGQFRVDLFYNLALPPAMEDTGNEFKTANGLTIGSFTDVDFTGVTNPVPADWNMYAIVDTFNAVSEGAAGGEDNNITGPEPLSWRGVDLRITLILPSVTDPVINDTITVQVTVQNQGNVAAGPFDVGLFRDRGMTPPSVGDAADQTEPVVGLGPGASTTVTFTGVSSSTPGSWQMYAIADNASPDAVGEYDETNNVAGPVPVTWRAPDLVILSITPSNSSPTVGDTISVDVVVENQGDADAGAFDVGLYFNELSAPSPGDPGTNGKATPEGVAGLAAGLQTTVTFSGITNVTEETWQMYAAADDKAAGGDVAEGDETNNVNGPTSVVWNPTPKPDLVILSVVVVPTTDPSIGESLSVVVTVDNQGTAGAGSFVVGLFYDESPPPPVGGAADQTAPVATLAVDDPLLPVVFTNVTSSTVGAWNLYAVVDNGSAVDESDEGNNVYGATTVTWHAPELVITSVVPLPGADPLIDDVISVEVTVQNQGDVAAGAFEVELFYNEAVAPSVGAAGDGTQPVVSLGIGASTTVTFLNISSSVAEAWSMYAIVDNGTAVLESNEGNNVVGPTAVTWHAPDLVITAVTPTPNNPLVGGTTSVDVTVLNQGDVAAGAFVVALFYNKAIAPSVGDTPDDTRSVVSLGIAASTTVTFANIPNSVAETWSMYAIADNGSTVSESDETNNVYGPTPVTWRQADLVVLSITPSNSSPTVGDNITVDVIVENQGNADAGAFDVGLYFNEAVTPSPGQGADGTDSTIVSLAAGVQTTVTFTLVTSATAETWQMYAIVDDAVSGGAVSESDEANNVGGPTSVQWNPLATFVDLIIFSVVPDDPDPAIGQAITVNVIVENTGTATAGSFAVGLFYDESVPPSVGAAADETQAVLTLAAGAQTVVSFTGVTSASTAVWSTYAIADNATPPGAVSENDETNNVSTATTVTWHAPELVITAVTPLPSADPLLGDTISIDVTIQNQGDADAGAFDVELFYNEAVAPSVGATGDGTQSVASLVAAASTTVTFLSISSSVAEAWSMYAIVDNGTAVLESNEGNNVVGPTAVTWHAPDLVITAVTPTPNNPLVGGTTSVDVTVLNQGDVVAGAFVVALFYNKATAPSVGDLPDDTRSVAALASSTSTTVTFAGVPNSVAETWSMYAAADNGTAVTEGDETNNVNGPTAVTWRQADLVITAIVPSNGSPTEGNTISVDVTVENQGNADATAFDVGLFYNESPAPAPGAAADQTQNVGSLIAGNSTTLTFAGIINATAETWEMYAIADNKAASGDVVESDETNNVGGPTSVVWNPAPRPDLVILSVTPTGPADPYNPSIEDTIAVEVLIENQGTAAAGSFEVGLFTNSALPPSVGDPADAVETVASLGVGIQTTVTFNGVWSDVAEVWSMYAAVDNGEAVTETDEGNNVFSPAVTVAWHAADLAILSITPDNSDPDIGQTITVTVVVTNLGDADAGNFVVGLFYDRATAPTVGEVADLTEPGPALPLAPAGTVNVIFTGISNSSIGAWSMYADADNGLAVKESDETNNVAGPAAVIWHGPDLVVTVITPSVSALPVGGSITVDVTVRNQGDWLATGPFDVGLFRNRATAPPVGGAADMTMSVPSLGAGVETTLTFDDTGILTSSIDEVWKTWALVDNATPPGAVFEGNELNNAAGPVTITWGAPEIPDLIVVSVTPTDVNPGVPGTIDVEVVIENTSDNGTASGFSVGLYYDLAAAPAAGDPADGTKAVATLAPNETKTLTFTGVPNGVPGIWQMYALVDSDGVVDESDESNNYGGPVEITWGAGVVILEPNGGETWESGTTYSIGWRSYGAVDWTEVKIEYSVDSGGNWTTIEDPTADVGSYAWTVPLADSTSCLVRVTTIGGSQEYSDVSDGAFTIRPSVTTKPDLVVVSVAPSSYMPATGQVITVDVAVRNAGTAPVSFFYVDLFFDSAPAPLVGDGGDLSVPVETILQPGSEMIVRFENITSTVVAAWQTYAIVDTLGYVTESNEDNNVTDKPVNIGWSTLTDWFRISSPNGGEEIEQGEVYTIQWMSSMSAASLVRIDVSTDGGITWQNVATNESNDGSYEWLVDAPTSTDCRIRVSSFSGDVTDVSDGVFAIGPEGANALLYIGDGCRAGAPAKSARGAALWVACLAALWVIARRRPSSGLTTQ